jgi:hypothetical protein
MRHECSSHDSAASVSRAQPTAPRARGGGGRQEFRGSALPFLTRVNTRALRGRRKKKHISNTGNQFIE